MEFKQGDKVCVLPNSDGAMEGNAVVLKTVEDGFLLVGVYVSEFYDLGYIQKVSVSKVIKRSN